MVDKDLETKAGAQAKSDAAESAAEAYADTEIETHRSNEVHDADQPPKSHGNEAHDSEYVTVSTAPLSDADGDDVIENNGPYRGVVISDSNDNPLLTVTESSDGATITIEASSTVTVDGDVACTGEVKEDQSL